MSGIYKCHDCHMSFGTMQLLNKHKRKFCIGGSLGDPDNLMLRRPLRSVDSPPPVSPPESVRKPRNRVVDEKVGELKALKERVNKKHDIRNLEERILLDELQDADRKLGIVSPVYRSKSKLPPSRYKDVRKLQEEYENLQDQENVRQRSPLPPTRRKSRASSAMTDTSMSIHLDDEEYTRYNPNQDARAQQLAETHGRQMEYLSLRNRDLEKQRDDIRRRLEQLGTKGVKVDPDNTQQLLEELRAQERRNQLSLEELRRQLMNMNHSRVNVIEVEKPIIQQQLPPPPPPQPETSRKSYIYPVYYGNSLVAEISALRQAYMQNGGNDIELLDHMAQLQAEAQAIEEAMRKQGMEKQRAPKEKKDVSDHLKTLEFENERLHRELMLLQNLKLKQKSDREDDLERELRRLQADHLGKMMGLQNELELLKQRMLLEKPPQQIRIETSQPPQPQLPPPPRPYVEVEPMAPYDQYAGFVIFYDFVLNMDPRVTACRLIVGLHSTSAVVGDPTVLPTVYTEPATRGTYYQNSSNAVIGARQPVPKCPAQSDLGIVVELQTSGGPASEYDKHSLITRAWTKLPVFDNDGNIIAGKFRIPFRNVPIKPYLHASQLQSLNKYGDVELYYRLVNMRDAEVQSLVNISAANYSQYRAPEIPPLLPYPRSPQRQLPPPPPPSEPPPQSTPRRSRQEQRLPNIQPGSPQDTTIGFQVDRVKNAEQGEGKIRLTAYYASTGKVVQSSTSPVTCSTTAVKSNFKYGYHVFGQQEATFNDVDMQGDMVVIARFYLRKRQDVLDDYIPGDQAQEATLYDEETLVAWAAVPLILSNDQSLGLKSRANYNPSNMYINSGTHTLKLYYPPVPEPSRIPFEDLPLNRDWKRYGRSTLRLHIFQGQPRPGSLSPSDLSDDAEEVLPEFAWLPLERKTPLKEPFLTGDGFDIYVDGCRYLPDSVTFTKVAGRVLDKKYEVYGKDINAPVKLDSDIYNPVYEHKTEYRESNLPPSATLLFKIYTVDNFYKGLTVVGFATLNIFVESGTERQPPVDKPGLQISLNEGAHQLRLYSQGPNGVDPLTESCLRDTGIRVLPCASLLVRITKVPKGPNGKALESSKVPQADWLRLGLWSPRPKYSDRIYYSSKCMPSRGESKLFHSMMRRPAVTNREAVAKVAQAKESFLRSDKNLEEYIRNKLTKGTDSKPLEQDLNFICQYSPKTGIKVSVDSAMNLPWGNFTHVHMCLNPPGAFYLGPPHATYDKLTFTELLDLRSTNTSPVWKDGFKDFPRRSFHRFLTLIIHLQEIQVTIAKDNYKYGLLEQAWTALQVFTDKYVYTTTFQLPLFQGSPTPQMLKQLAREPCKEWLERNIRGNVITLLDGASVFVRLADGRREDELASDIPGNRLLEVNTDYIPPQMEEDYSRERPGKPLDALVPSGKSPEQFVDSLAGKFKNLVYKLYEEGNISK